MADNHARPGRVLTINDLPDDDLLAVFDFSVVGYQDLDYNEILSGNHWQDTTRKIRSWQSLVHVCRRWRGLVFSSPRRLNLQLFCTTRTPARETLNVWPALPILIQGDVSETLVNNVIAALEHSDRIRQINLDFDTTLQIENFWTAFQVPFPELVVLRLSFEGLSIRPVLPDLFLASETAQRLRVLSLVAVSFRGLPSLLMSATHLINLYLHGIPHSGYISPKVMATSLSMLTNLESLRLEFESPQSCPDQESQRKSPPTRYVLPALTKFWFKGANEYSEELLARIDTPRLYLLRTTFFNDIDFDVPELIRFITLTSGAPRDVHVVFDSCTAWVKLQRQASLSEYVRVEISCRAPDWQLSSLAQIFTSSLSPLSTTVNLYIYEDLQSQLDWKDGIGNTEWLELLSPFTAVKDLYLSKQFTPRIAPAIQELMGGRTTEVLPTLQNIFLEGFQPSEPIHEGIRKFISARQLTNRPVTISAWEGVSVNIENRKALVIGINYSRHQDPRVHLTRCIADAHGMADFLRGAVALFSNRYDIVLIVLANLCFSPSDIRLMTDESITPAWNQPTKENILGAMGELVYGAQPHDSLFLYFSGHGIQIMDLNGDQRNGLNVCICAMDYLDTPYQKNADTPGLIVNYIMREIMVKSLPPRCHLTAIFDVKTIICDIMYEYTDDVSALAVVPLWDYVRSSPYCMSTPFGTTPSRLTYTAQYRSDGVVKKFQDPYGLDILKESKAVAISLSAGEDHQTDSNLESSTHLGGALRRAFIDSMRRSNNTLTYKELFQSVREYTRKNKFQQKPQLSSSHEIDTNLRFIV